MTVGEAVQIRILGLCLEYDLTINKLSTISGVNQSTVTNSICKRSLLYSYRYSIWKKCIESKKSY